MFLVMSLLSPFLSEFLTDFEIRHEKTLPKWLGDLDKFAGEEALVEEKFSGS